MAYFSTEQWSRLLFILFVLQIFLLPSSAPADEWESCDAHAVTDQDMQHCAAIARDSAEKKMNLAYDQLMKKNSLEGKARLAKAKQAWEAYRQQQCSFNTMGSEGGTIHTQVFIYCEADLANDYAHILESQFNCPEGTLNCGSQ